VQCEPLSSVVDFSELIGLELVTTLKREIVPDGMVYECANLQKIWGYGTFFLEGPNRAIQHKFQTALSTDSA
jgi:hypothetical protein